MTNNGIDRYLKFGLGSIKKYIPVPSTYKHIVIIIKILFGVALLVLSIQGIQWKNLVSGILTADLSWLILAIISVLVGLFLKVWRWALLVKYYHIRASKTRLFSAYFLGQAVNILLPLRAGEVIRIGYFSHDPKIIPEVTSTVVLEKYMDLVALAVCGILVSFRFSLDNILNLRGLFLPLMIIMTVFLLVTIFFGPALWEKIRSGSWMPMGFRDCLDRWVQASLWLRKPKLVLPSIVLSIFIWIMMWLTNILLFNSFGLPLGGAAAGLVLISVYLGQLPALMPGNIGPFYFSARLALFPFGIINDPALTFAVVLHAIVTLPPLLGGVIGVLINPRSRIA